LGIGDCAQSPIPNPQSPILIHCCLYFIKTDIIKILGDWGLGIGDWAQSPIPNPQSPNPNKILINLIINFNT